MTRRGFTLIEVMVALAILGIGLASLFTSQVGAIKVAQRARSTTVATLLARCKMGEIEERVLSEGIPYDDISEHDECCEDMEHEGYECEWSIERIVLPDQTFDEEEEGLLDALGASGEEEASEEGLEEGNLPDPNELGEDDMSSVLAGGATGGGMLEMITGMTLPIMKPIIEEQVRRANVTVTWTEGEKEMSFDVAQFLVSEVGAAPPDPTEDETSEQQGQTGSGGTAPAGGASPPGGAGGLLGGGNR